MTPQRRNTSPAVARHYVSARRKKACARAEAGSSKRLFYKPLAKEFRSGEFAYRQITREGSAAIYEQIWNGCANAMPCYEIVWIRRREGFQIGNRFVERAEFYPNSEAWGVDGWTAEDKESAFRKLQTLVIDHARTSRAKRNAMVRSQIESE